MQRHLPLLFVIALALVAGGISSSCSWMGKMADGVKDGVEGVVERVKGEHKRAHRHGDKTLTVTTTEEAEGPLRGGGGGG